MKYILLYTLKYYLLEEVSCMDILFSIVLLIDTLQIIISAPITLQASTPEVMYLSHKGG